ncbi:MAG: hypothetical protein ACK53L_20930, partial [Pirellulaceae bacterium]
MHELVTAVEAHATIAEPSRSVDQASHQQPVGFQKMDAIGWIPARQGLVGGDGGDAVEQRRVEGEGWDGRAAGRTPR